jgi:hypothetical protein
LGLGERRAVKDPLFDIDADEYALLVQSQEKIMEMRLDGR